jgi:hypothetical protein
MHQLNTYIRVRTFYRLYNAFHVTVGRQVGRPVVFTKRLESNTRFPTAGYRILLR